MRNNFSEETRGLFIDCYKCWICGKNTADALHHILGRVSDSPLNAAPVCNFTCHINRPMHTEQTRQDLIKKTFFYLIKKGYALTKKDKEFILKNFKYYQFLLQKNGKSI
jgi:hypothetical protein